MKKLLILIVAIAMGCGKDDPEPSYNFKNQTAAGKIEGVAWTFVEGRAQDIGDNNLSFDLMLDQAEDPCEFQSIEGDQVFFTIPNEVGVYELKFSLSGGTDNIVATLFDVDEFLNVIATEGAIEIISITPTQVTGRLDVRADGDNFVNGNFTVTVCQ